jgi:hypothetical protein
MSQSYRVVDFTSNSVNTIFDYVIKADNNIIYRTFKAARCAANLRVKSYIGEDIIPDELSFKQNQKKECDTNANLHRIVNLPAMEGVQAMIMIIPVNSFKGDLPEEVPIRRSARVGNKIVRPNYVEILSDSDSDSESDLVAYTEGVRRPAVKKEKPDAASMAAVSDAVGMLPGIMTALAIQEHSGGGSGSADCGDPINYYLPPPPEMEDDL